MKGRWSSQSGEERQERKRRRAFVLEGPEGGCVTVVARGGLCMLLQSARRRGQRPSTRAHDPR
jgi:hypothetical protein